MATTLLEVARSAVVSPSTRSADRADALRREIGPDRLVRSALVADDAQAPVPLFAVSDLMAVGALADGVDPVLGGSASGR